MIVVSAIQTSGGRGRKPPPSLQREGAGSGAEVGGVAGGAADAGPPTYPSLRKFLPSGLRKIALSLTQPTSMDAAAKNNPAVEISIIPSSYENSANAAHCHKIAPSAASGSSCRPEPAPLSWPCFSPRDAGAHPRR